MSEHREPGDPGSGDPGRSGSGARRSGHLDAERTSRLLDEREADPRDRAHLERCDACRLEYERMSRMRMALSGLGELEPPAGEWSAIEARLDAGRGSDALVASSRGPSTPGGRPGDPGPAEPGRRLRRGVPAALGIGPLQAAAAVALFAAGILAGLNLPGEPGGAASSGEPPAASVASARPGAPGATGDPAPAASAAGSAYQEALDGLGELQGPVPVSGRQGGELDPVAAAERLARLDALILASQEALEQAPADPVANGLLFDLVERRDALASDLQQSLRLVTLEYR